MEKTDLNKDKALFLYNKAAFAGVALKLNSFLFSWITRQFDCVSLDINCDLELQIKAHKPDVIIYYGPRENITYVQWVAPLNYTYAPEIPRIGINARDKHSPTCIAADNCLRELGCEAVFCVVPSKAEMPVPYTGSTYFLPITIDESIFYAR